MLIDIIALDLDRNKAAIADRAFRENCPSRSLGRATSRFPSAKLPSRWWARPVTHRHYIRQPDAALVAAADRISADRSGLEWERGTVEVVPLRSGA
jgi:hypothetical protein